MWRSFFYAVGIGLFALGFQTLIVEHVTVPENTKIQKLLKKVFENDKPVAGNVQQVPPQLSAPGANQLAPNWAQQANQASVGGQSYGVNTGSRFGPSRFSGPAYGTGYGGPRVNSGFGGGVQGFNAPQYGNSTQYQNQNRTNAQFAGYSSPGPVEPAIKPQLKLQKIVVREWMPWSLLASGAIIFLYTHSHHRRRSDA